MIKKIITHLRETFSHLSKNIVPPPVIVDMKNMK